MIKILSHSDFKKMPWKNGGGETLELYRIDHENDSTLFHLRLSMATVQTDGPFSHFPGIDRTIMLLEGNGCVLKFSNREHSLVNRLIPFNFPGEENIQCDLVNGPIKDFNVMIDRRWGVANVEILSGSGQLACLEDYLFSFDPIKMTLNVLKRGEVMTLEDPDHKKIVIRIRKTI